MNTPTSLITGASSGIGLDLAHLFAAKKYDLILVARREDKLREVAAVIMREHGVKVEVIAADLSQPAAPAALVAELERRGLAVDVLVNNAGFGDRGAVAELSVERQRDMLQVNVTALTELSRYLLPAMLQRKRGGILNVASTAAFQPGPFMSVYYASKAYVLSFSEGLAEELRDTGVTVTCLCPGATATEFAQEANMTESRLFQMGAMTSKEVARAALDGFLAGKVIVVPGIKNKLGAQSVRFSPRWMVRRLVRVLNGNSK
jgi:uncharacterized protein